MKKKNGYTLVEILVVIALIGVLIGIAVPSIMKIRERINLRSFEEKKSQMLVAAELYAKDNNMTTSSTVTIDTLLEQGYIEADVKKGTDECTKEYGCILDPTTGGYMDTGLTDNQIFVKVIKDNYNAVWNGSESTDAVGLVETAKKAIGCTSVPCEYSGEAENNYLYYSGIMWRVMGVYYNVDGNEVAKLVSDDTVIWEDGEES